MPYVNFRAASIREFGLPQACPCCGNDDDGTIELKNADGQQYSRTARIGGCFLCLFLGPIGWLLGPLILLARSTKLSFPLPRCALCVKASRRLWYRTIAIVLSASTLSSIAIFYPLLANIGWVLTAAVVVMLVSLFEYSWLSGQFNLKIRSSDSESALVYVPYEEYPALYQRHLDNAALYGSSEKLGTQDS